MSSTDLPQKEEEKKGEEEKKETEEHEEKKEGEGDEKEEGSEKSNKSKNSKKKGDKPKKKKMSKKELARIKREKAEQERLEQERIEFEKQMQREKEEELRKRQEQQQRLQEEMEDITKFRQSRIEKIRAINEEKEKEEDWQIFSSCDHSVDVRSEADVNTFIEQWSEVNETSLDELFEHIKQAHVIRDKLRLRSENHHLSGETKQMERCDKQIGAICNLIMHKLDNITAHILAFNDKLKDPQIYGDADDLSFGMWVKSIKNPRIKSADGCTGVTVEFTGVVAMYNLAIRGIRYNFHPEDEHFLFIDRILHLEFLQLQAPAKKIGSMVIRQPPHSSTIQKLEYPLRGATKPCPPLTIRMKLNENTLNEYCEDATIVMLKDGKVDQTTIVKCQIEDNTVVFSTIHIGTFALAVPKYKHFPFQFWEISGQSPTSVEIYLQTALLELALNINQDGLVSMESPFQFTNLTPIAAMNFILERGINLVAPEEIEGIIPKDANVEEVLHTGIADCAVGFDIRCSKYNSSLSSDRAMLLVREKANYDEESSEEKDEQNIKESHAILVKAFHVVEVENTELGDTVSQSSIDKEVKIHQHLLPMFFDNASEPVQKVVREAPPHIYNAVLFFMNKLRLFSMTQ